MYRLKIADAQYCSRQRVDLRLIHRCNVFFFFLIVSSGLRSVELRRRSDGRTRRPRKRRAKYDNRGHGILPPLGCLSDQTPQLDLMRVLGAWLDRSMKKKKSANGWRSRGRRRQRRQRRRRGHARRQQSRSGWPKTRGEHHSSPRLGLASWRRSVVFPEQLSTLFRAESTLDTNEERAPQSDGSPIIRGAHSESIIERT